MPAALTARLKAVRKEPRCGALLPGIRLEQVARFVLAIVPDLHERLNQFRRHRLLALPCFGVGYEETPTVLIQIVETQFLYLAMPHAGVEAD
jgi:hypothetical protein